RTAYWRFDSTYSYVAGRTREAGTPWSRISTSSKSNPAQGNGALTSWRRTRLIEPRSVALNSGSVTSSAATGFPIAFLCARLRRPKRLLIGGEWVEAASGRTFADVDPATGDTLVEIAAGDAEDVDAAVAAARRAFEHGRWPALKPDERSRILWRIAEAIEEHA